MNLRFLKGKIELIQAIVDFVTEETLVDVELIRKAMYLQVLTLRYNKSFIPLHVAVFELRFLFRPKDLLCENKDTNLCCDC